MDGASSQDSASRSKDALAMFDLYNVPRPPGWLSEEHSRPEFSAKTIQICHSCGVSLVLQAPCSDCGHDFCFKCTTKMIAHGSQSSIVHGSDATINEAKKTVKSGGSTGHDPGWAQELVDKEEDVAAKEPEMSQGDDGELRGTPSSSSDGANDDVQQVKVLPMTPAERQVAQRIVPGSIRDNPFFKADQSAKAGASAAQTTPTYARAKKPRRLSDCVPRRFEDSTASPSKSQGTVSGQGEQPEAGERHPICCAAHQFLDADGKAGQDEQDGGHSDQMLQRRIDRLYKRAEELHASRHMMRHLANAVKGTGAEASHEMSAMSVSSLRSSLRSSNATSGTTSSRRGRLDSLQDDGGTQPAALSESTGIRHQVEDVYSSPMRARLVEADDVFGPQSDFQPGQLESKGRANSSEPRKGRDRSIPREPRDSKLKVKDELTESRASMPTRESDEDDDVSSIPLLPPRHLDQGLETAKSGESRETTKKHGRLSIRRSRSFSRSAGSDPDVGRAAQSSSEVASSVTSIHELPSMTGFGQHRRGTQLCLPSQGEDTKPDPWPILRKVSKLEPGGRPQTPGSVPWSRPSLRRVSSNFEGSVLTDDVISASEWKQRQMSKGEGDDGHVGSRLTRTTPASQWRKNLNKVPERHADESGKRRTRCSFCDPNELSSPPGEEGVGGECNHESARRHHDQERRVDAPTPSASRLRVRQVEQSLAQKQGEDEWRQARKARFDTWNVGRDSEARDEEEAHSCSWRERYMKLSAEVDKWKSELKSCDPGEEVMASRRDIGVGEAIAQQAASDDLGIEGLTIVVHMRHRDDLVINTDLRGNQARSRQV
ncbi:hypothetical protein CDD82_5961 [Ophiocordyceps australis]|uniref:RING-type domain-containing protein n=1 Tax=Ophiocordyceps australis TaxID=1399860 RepID=A0A2C5YUM9_9HYPO|nr:hypothetical protein CDD82_5961 [Ophiocordyceps australis]